MIRALIQKKGGRSVAFKKDGKGPKRFYRGQSLRLPQAACLPCVFVVFLQGQGEAE